MEKKGGKSLIAWLVKKLSLPPEIDAGIPKLVMTGSDELMIENHKGVLCYTEEEARFLSSGGVICVRGSGLELYEFSPERACLRGRIRGWAYEDGT